MIAPASSAAEWTCGSSRSPVLATVWMSRAETTRSSRSSDRSWIAWRKWAECSGLGDDGRLLAGLTDRVFPQRARGADRRRGEPEHAGGRERDRTRRDDSDRREHGGRRAVGHEHDRAEGAVGSAAQARGHALAGDERED